MAKAPPQPISLLLNQEIAAVVTAMRQNAKWAMVPTRYTRLQDDEMGDDPLLDDFKVLRRRIFHWHDWSVVDPLEYLGPFLEVIRSSETSGPITGTALTSLSRFLDQFIVGESNGNVANVMRITADAVTQCKFEATDPSSDEVVLFKILQVLLACIKCPGGRYLTNDNVINIFQACFRIGHYAGDHQKDMTDLLTAASRQVMVEMVSIIFSEMSALPASPKGALHSPKKLLDATAPAQLAEPSSPKKDVGAEHDSSKLEQPENGRLVAANGAAAAESAADAGPLSGAGLLLEKGEMHGGAGREDSTLASASGLPGISIPKTKSGVKSDDSAGHGLESVVEVLGFIIGLIGSDGNGLHADLNVFGLELMNVALNAGGSGFEKHKALMLLLREDLWGALFLAVRTGKLGTLAGAGQVALSLWSHLGTHLLLQLDAFLQSLLLRLAQGSRSAASQHQEAALEGLLDLCNQAGFIRAVYANLDCRIERSNLFESICSLLSKTAFPVNSPLGSVHLHSLEGLFSILNALSKGCTGMSTWDSIDGAESPQDFVAVWEARCDGLPPPLLSRRPRIAEPPSGGDLDSPHSRAKAKADEERRAMTETALLEKWVKVRLAAAAEHFNRDFKKGFQFLQTIHLLKEKPNAKAVARFLRYCPGLNKVSIGDLLGEHDDFFLEVLDEFTSTFQFLGTSFDSAMREFLESFRLPGEAQKINRIMESFGSHYHRQCPQLFKNADAVYILAYSVILLNTDQHNSQVKKKMTCDEFIRNNRGINGGDNLPVEFLRSLYDSISRNEIRISSDAAAAPSSVAWSQLAQASTSPRGRTLDLVSLSTPQLDRQMFGLMWGPTVAAVSVVLDHAEDPTIVRHALDGLLLAAKIAAFHHVDEVMDSLVVSLSKFTAFLDPAAPKPALAFGENEKARMATQTLFMLANRYGDSLRTGWKNLLSCMMRLFQLNLLPPSVLLLESEDGASARDRLPRPSASRRMPASASLLSRAFSSLISIDSGESASAEARPREAAASQNTAACIEACRLDELIADSKFLRAESLIELVKAIMWASGPVNRIAASGEESDTAELGVELVIVVALRNRDRLLLIWPLVHDLLSTILAPESARTANALVRRAALGLMRICRRLLHYKADSAEALLRSLGMILRLDPTVAWDLAPAIAAEVLELVRTSGSSIKTTAGWRTVCLLITTTSLSPDACSTSLAALHQIAREPVLSPIAFMHCLESAAAFIDNQNKAVQPEASLKALQVLEDMYDWLLSHVAALKTHDEAADAEAAATARPHVPALSLTSSSSPTAANTEAKVSEMWLALLKLLGKVSADSGLKQRDVALQLLQRVMMGGDALGLSKKLLLAVLEEELLPLTAHFAHKLVSAKRESRIHAPALRSSLKLLSKSLLHYMPQLAAEAGFPDLWARLLQLMQDCTKTKSEELTEIVPEALKNMLLVMAAQGILTPAWQDGEGHSLWDLTWHRAQSVSSGLTPAMLASSGLVVAAPDVMVQPASAEPAPPNANITSSEQLGSTAEPSAESSVVATEILPEATTRQGALDPDASGGPGQGPVAGISGNAAAFTVDAAQSVADSGSGPVDVHAPSNSEQAALADRQHDESVDDSIAGAISKSDEARGADVNQQAQSRTDGEESRPAEGAGIDGQPKVRAASHQVPDSSEEAALLADIASGGAEETLESSKETQVPSCKQS